MSGPIKDRTRDMWIHHCLSVLERRNSPPERKWFYTNEGHQLVSSIWYAIQRDKKSYMTAS